jgi:hypothetical protein
MSTLALANGVIIDTNTGQVITPTINPEAASVKEQPSRKTYERGRDKNNRVFRLNAADLPAAPRSITSIGVVWLYFMLGLSDHDIADATGMRMDQVEHIKGLQLFDRIGKMLIDNAAKLHDDDIRTRLIVMSSSALDNIEDIAGDAEVDAAVKLRAAQDVLDRAGFGAKQIHEHNVKMSGGLVIKYIDDTESTKPVPEMIIDHNAEIVDA